METKYIEIETKGETDIIDITPHIEKIVEEEEVVNGMLFLSLSGSTAGITTMEYEPGLISDLKNIFDKLLPYKRDYEHNFTWSDNNAHSHLRSLFIKPQLFVSVTSGKLDLGTWQQVVLIDFDTTPRKRKIVVKIIPS